MLVHELRKAVYPVERTFKLSDIIGYLLSDETDEATPMLFCFIYNDIFGESTMGDMIEFYL